MAVSEERRRVAQIFEDYIYGRISDVEFDEMTSTFKRSLKDETVRIIAFEIVPDEIPTLNKEVWNYWQRLLLLLKSDAELKQSEGVFINTSYPFRSFSDLRRAYKSAEGFKKTNYRAMIESGEHKTKQKKERTFSIFSGLFTLFILIYMFKDRIPKALECGKYFSSAKEDLFLGLYFIVIFAVTAAVAALILTVNDRLKEKELFTKTGEEGAGWFVNY